MKEKFIHYYMDIARRTAQLSYAEKLKVGAVLVKNNNIISFSYNGSPAGHSNILEEIIDGELKTKPEVAHAEENLIMKLARSHESAEGSTLFVTHNPCFVCSRLIYGSGIKKVYYESDYRDSSGIQFLLDCGVEIEKYDRK